MFCWSCHRRRDVQPDGACDECHGDELISCCEGGCYEPKVQD